MNKWAIVGLGFISQRHIQAIHDIGDKLVMVCDIDESKKEKVPDIEFFKDFYKMVSSKKFKEEVDWIAVCTPNYLHFPMVMHLLKNKKNVLCEKPLVIKSDDLKSLAQLYVPMKVFGENSKLYTMMQLRHNPELQELKDKIDKDIAYKGELILSINRGEFYHKGWKGDKEKSGGLLFNIGVHYIDLLIWIFGEPISWELKRNEDKVVSGNLKFSNADIDWLISIEAPMDNQVRRLKINGFNVDLARHFEDLHTKVYEDINSGIGVTPGEAGRSIALIEKILNEKK